MTAPVKACTLGAWRLRHAKLTQQEAAERSGLPHADVSRLENYPSEATVGALASYVRSCGGKLECWVEIRGVRRLLVLLAVLLAGCGGAADDISEPETTEYPGPQQVEPACFWGHPEACELCAGHRDYGQGNTCTDVIWRGRSDTDFCLQTFPCDAPAQPVTKIYPDE